MTNQTEHTTVSTTAGVNDRQRSREVLLRASLLIVILLCISACALMFIIDPFSLDVESVYQGF
jgi:hypothetical protein